MSLLKQSKMHTFVIMQSEFMFLISKLRQILVFYKKMKQKFTNLRGQLFSKSKSEEKKILSSIFGGFFAEGEWGFTNFSEFRFFQNIEKSGLLVEADPSNFKKLKTKHRRAWAAQVCLSPHPFPVKVMFKQDFNTGKIAEPSTNTLKKGYVQVQCLPLASLLAALSRTTVHYFSLDVEGLELQVLQTIPFEKLDIKGPPNQRCCTAGGEHRLPPYTE
ncbi:unnamed protein product, partial [Meganyctiphanes norvegica]